MSHSDKFSVAAEWRAFEHAVLPANASDVQREEMRKAFWAGAFALWAGLLNVLEPGTEATEADLAKMDDLKREFDNFAAEMGAKVRGGS